MKNVWCVTLAALSLLVLAATAQAKNAQANGTFDFSLEGATGVIVFDADGSDGGPVHGSMSLTATVEVGDPEGDGGTVPTNVSIQAQFDCLVVQDNQAAMSGAITSASPPEYVGQQVMLVVVDKVDDIRPPTDAFAWGISRPAFVNLNATDSEYCPAPDPESEFFPPCNVDTGASLTWIASDYELCPNPTEENPTPPCTADPGAYREGISTIPTLTTCDSIPLSAIELNLVPRGHGNKVQVKHND